MGRKLLDQGQAASRTGSLSRLIEADTAFHQWIYATAGNRVLIETMAHYWKHMQRIMSAVLSMDSWPPMVWQEHEVILSAIITGDSGRAEHLARQHVEGASQALLVELKSRGAPAGITT